MDPAHCYACGRLVRGAYFSGPIPYCAKCITTGLGRNTSEFSHVDPRPATVCTRCNNETKDIWYQLPGVVYICHDCFILIDYNLFNTASDMYHREMFELIPKLFEISCD